MGVPTGSLGRRILVKLVSGVRLARRCSLTAVATAFHVVFRVAVARRAWKFVELSRSFPHTLSRCSRSVTQRLGHWHPVITSCLFCFFCFTRFWNQTFQNKKFFTFHQILLVFTLHNLSLLFYEYFPKHHFLIFPSRFKLNKLIAVQGFVPNSAKNILSFRAWREWGCTGVKIRTSNVRSKRCA